MNVIASKVLKIINTVANIVCSTLSSQLQTMAENECSEHSLKEEEHHKQYELCKTRPAYRQGRQLTAVKVYTVNSESQHLCIYGVPKINLRSELKNLCTRYGKITNIHIVLDYKTELFTECYHVQYERIQSARVAKRLLDNKSFYGGILHVCYSPEYESIEETRAKLQQRTKDVMNRINNGDQTLSYGTAENEVKLEEFANISKSQIKKKRKQHDNFSENGETSKDLHPQSTSVSSKRFKSGHSSFN